MQSTPRAHTMQTTGLPGAERFGDVNLWIEYHPTTPRPIPTPPRKRPASAHACALCDAQIGVSGRESHMLDMTRDRACTASNTITVGSERCCGDADDTIEAVMERLGRELNDMDEAMMVCWYADDVRRSDSSAGGGEPGFSFASSAFPGSASCVKALPHARTSHARHTRTGTGPSSFTTLVPCVQLPQNRPPHCLQWWRRRMINRNLCLHELQWSDDMSDSHSPIDFFVITIVAATPLFCCCLHTAAASPTKGNPFWIFVQVAAALK